VGGQALDWLGAGSSCVAGWLDTHGAGPNPPHYMTNKRSATASGLGGSVTRAAAASSACVAMRTCVTRATAGSLSEVGGVGVGGFGGESTLLLVWVSRVAQLPVLF